KSNHHEPHLAKGRDCPPPAPAPANNIENELLPSSRQECKKQTPQYPFPSRPVRSRPLGLFKMPHVAKPSSSKRREGNRRDRHSNQSPTLFYFQSYPAHR
ncbi:hypothetical protein JMJ77_0011236, partial [Colletotrichum scovillei]